MEKQITIKIREEDKQVIEQAAKLLGMGHSTFCRSVSLERARKILKENTSP